MKAREARIIMSDVCREFGVDELELRHGTKLKTTGGRWPAQLTVSLARYTLLWRLWQAGADHVEAGIMLAITSRRVRGWYADFEARQRHPVTLRKTRAA